MPTARLSAAVVVFAALLAPRSAARAEEAKMPPLSESDLQEKPSVAVARGLKWLADHQLPDGGWSFNPKDAPERLRFADPGEWKSRTGATGIALLPFLGAGQTHKGGAYKMNVKAGLTFLLKHAQEVRAQDGAMAALDLRGQGGDATWHAVATMALCEAYAMTNDKGLHGSAQLALHRLASLRDPKSGGWSPGGDRPADMPTTAWAILAMKSGHVAYLRVDREAVVGAPKLLDALQSGNGAYYGRTASGKDPHATAMALYFRRQLGWKDKQAALRRGEEYLGGVGPAEDDCVRNYFARLLFNQSEDPRANEWRDALRGTAADGHVREGAEAGSWFNPKDVHAQGSGRLFQTAICAMTLSIRFRMWNPGKSDEDFPD